MTPLKAIRKECMYCMGKSSQLVEDCSSSECALYPFRLGTNPNIGPRLLTEDQKEVLRDQLKGIRSKKL